MEIYTRLIRPGRIWLRLLIGTGDSAQWETRQTLPAEEAFSSVLMTQEASLRDK